jgi:hypothetical protein
MIGIITRTRKGIYKFPSSNNNEFTPSFEIIYPCGCIADVVFRPYNHDSIPLPFLRLCSKHREEAVDKLGKKLWRGS